MKDGFLCALRVCVGLDYPILLFRFALPLTYLFVSIAHLFRCLLLPFFIYMYIYSFTFRCNSLQFTSVVISSYLARFTCPTIAWFEFVGLELSCRARARTARWNVHLGYTEDWPQHDCVRHQVSPFKSERKRRKRGNHGPATVNAYWVQPQQTIIQLCAFPKERFAK